MLYHHFSIAVLLSAITLGVASVHAGDPVTSLSGRYCIQRSSKNSIDVHDTQSGERMKFPHSSEVPLGELMVSDDNRCLVAVDPSVGCLTAFDLRTGARKRQMGGHDVLAGAMIPNSHVAIIIKRHVIFFKDVDTGAIVNRRISLGKRCKIYEVSIRYVRGHPQMYLRTNNARTGLYDLTTGAKLNGGQRPAGRSIIATR